MQDKIKISVFKNTFDKHPQIVTLKTVVEKIKSSPKLREFCAHLQKLTSKKEQLLFKQTKFPAITVSGIFKNGHSANGLSKHSGLIQIDIDNLKSSGSKSVQELREILKNDPYTFILFKSISGSGIKLFVKIDSSRHSESFNALLKYYKDKYGVNIDPKCKDIGRLCFLGYDPEIWINEASKQSPLEHSTVEPIKSPDLSQTSNDHAADIEIITRQIEGLKINITEGYDNWLRLGFALADELGELGRSYFHRLSSFHPEYDLKKADSQYTYCLKNGKTGITINSFFYLAKKYGVDMKTKNRNEIEKKDSRLSSNTSNNHGDQLRSPRHHTILKNLLEKIEKVNFRELAELDNKDSHAQSLKQKHYIVCVVDHVLRVASDRAWGICRNNDFIYLYNGEYWSMVSDEELKDFLGEAAQKMGIDKFDARFHMFRESLYKQFLAVANAPKPNRPCDTVVINLQNGTFEIKPEGGFIRKFRHEDFITYQLPFDYKPGANASLFNSYLQRVLPDKERQKVLAEFLGYIFTQSIKLEKCLLLYGSGANGKSVFFDIINALLGKENVSNCSLADLNKEYNRAMLGYKLLNYGSEIKGNAESDIFKQLVSGEPIQACRKYCDPFIMRNYAKLCFNCNELPKDVEHTEAYFRRFLIIPFDVTIPEDERNPQLAQEIIQSELSGVFNWILEGLSRLMAQGNFSKCEAIKQQIVNYKTQSDSVYLFLEDEGYQKSDSKWCLLKEMYPAYKSFCMNDGYRPVSKSNFKKRLESFGYLIERRNVGWAVYAAK